MSRADKLISPRHKLIWADLSHEREYDLGGFDEFVVKTFMDEVEFTHRSKVGNELRMVRALPKRR